MLKYTGGRNKNDRKQNKKDNIRERYGNVLRCKEYYVAASLSLMQEAW